MLPAESTASGPTDVMHKLTMPTMQMAVTMEEFMAQFYNKYLSGGYGPTGPSNAQAAAEALLGTLRKMMMRGDRENLRDALHSLKGQLIKADSRSPPMSRAATLDAIFELIDAIVVAAEKIRQFSPVKESFSAMILEEMRQRLLRIVTGDTFLAMMDVRRRALDCIYANLVREAQSKERAKGQIAAAAGAKARVFGKKVNGPGLSSWSGLWLSLSGMPGHRMLPLLQSALGDVYALAGQEQQQLQPAPPASPAKAGAFQVQQPSSARRPSSEDDVTAGQQDGPCHSGALSSDSHVAMVSSVASLALGHAGSSSLEHNRQFDSWDDYRIFSYSHEASSSMAVRSSTDAEGAGGPYFTPPEEWVHFVDSNGGATEEPAAHKGVVSLHARSGSLADVPTSPALHSPHKDKDDPFDEPFMPPFPADHYPTVHVRLTTECSVEQPGTPGALPANTPASAGPLTQAFARPCTLKGSPKTPAVAPASAAASAY